MSYKKIMFCLCGLISVFMLGACGNEAKKRNIEVTENVVAEGYDILGGTWKVGAIYYETRIISVQDVDGLEDLYDSTYLVFNEDGSFVYHNLYNYKGEYTKYNYEQYNSYLLKTTSLSKYDLDNGVLVEKEVESDSLKTFIITFLDENDTIEFNQYDSITGKSMADGNQLFFVKDNSSEYIDDNKAVVKNEKKENSVNDNNKKADNDKKDYTNSSVSNNISSGKKNALERALDYLDYSAFSYTGLIEQLEFEGFTNEEATYGADNCGANWNEQAVKKAEQYLDYTAFSYSGLVEQLEFEGFTHSQAEYGASQAY